jgi:hypothetical protein
MSQEPLAKATDSPLKKPYSAPQLVVYGDLRMITENMRMAGSDGAGGMDNFST